MSFTLHLGDCLDPLTGLASLADKSVDIVCVDPPYSEHVHGNARSTDGAKHEVSFAHLSELTRAAAAQQFARLSRRWILVFCEIEGAHLWRDSLEANGLEYIRTGQWVRTNSMPQITGDRPAAGTEAIVIAHPFGRKRWNGGGRPAVWSHPLAQVDGPRLHPTQKTESLMNALIRDFSDPGELVLDAFAGSGTTGVACIRNGRRFIGWELNPEYYAAATKRLAATREQLSMFEVAK